MSAGMEYHWVSVVRLDSGEGLEIPARANGGDAGFDLRAAMDALVPPGASKMIPTGFAWAIDAGWCGMVCPRSGLAAKHQVTVGNAPGIVDSGYRGEVCVILQNHGNDTFRVNRGDRIAQMVIVPVMMTELAVVESLDDTDRGVGGFGSTGVK